MSRKVSRKTSRKVLKTRWILRLVLRSENGNEQVIRACVSEKGNCYITLSPSLPSLFPLSLSLSLTVTKSHSSSFCISLYLSLSFFPLSVCTLSLFILFCVFLSLTHSSDFLTLSLFLFLYFSVCFFLSLSFLLSLSLFLCLSSVYKIKQIKIVRTYLAKKSQKVFEKFFKITHDNN